MERLLVVGSAIGGGAMQVVEAVVRTGVAEVVGVVDSDPRAHGLRILGVPVIGHSSETSILYSDDRFDGAVVAVGNVAQRRSLFERLRQESIPLVNVIDRDAIVSSFADIGVGNVFLAFSYVGPGVQIGDNCYLITGSKVNHHSVLGSHCVLSTGVSIAGRVVVGESVKFDTGSGAAPDCRIRPGSYIPPGVILTPSSWPGNQ